MALIDLTDWMDEHTGPDFIWYVKRLSGNDTTANNTHQAGPYIPKEFLFKVFPSLNRPEEKNPDKWFEIHIDSHTDVRNVRAVWYNSGTRNESRLTNFGGATSALLDAENTGALAVFAFRHKTGGDASECHVWVCEHETEDDLVEDRIGPVEPGKARVWTVDEQGLFPIAPNQLQNCWLAPTEIPTEWFNKFPTGAEIIRKTVELRSFQSLVVDQRLIKRRECEYELFRSVEEAIELPFIEKGFHTVDEFIARAQTILQRRKSRAGRSLELHIREIFNEENLTNFEYQPNLGPGQQPDFLFPSRTAYKDTHYPAQHLRMLAVKTTLKDRWRQILTEAERIQKKHLFTLQEGVSENQFREMTGVNIQLVVPASLQSKYPASVRPHLITLESFIADMRLLALH